MKIISGKTVEAQIRSIDRILASLAKRSGRFVIGALPPIPVFDYVEQPETETGVVLRRIIPGPGLITKGVLFIQKFNRRENITIDVSVESHLAGSHTKLQTSQAMNMSTFNLKVEPGMRLTVSLTPADAVSCIWTAFLYEVSFEGMIKQQFILDELLALMEGGYAEEVEAETEAADQEETVENERVRATIRRGAEERATCGGVLSCRGATAY
jgi:hypothetical protein